MPKFLDVLQGNQCVCGTEPCASNGREAWTVHGVDRVALQIGSFTAYVPRLGVRCKVKAWGLNRLFAGGVVGMSKTEKQYSCQHMQLPYMFPSLLETC